MQHSVPKLVMVMNCPKCKEQKVIKNGRTKNNKQQLDMQTNIGDGVKGVFLHPYFFALVSIKVFKKKKSKQIYRTSDKENAHNFTPRSSS